MADMYSKSYLTVTASRAQNSQHGFLYDLPEVTAHYLIKAETPWDTEGPGYRTLHAMFKINRELSQKASTPLDKRVWCLQEWYLPERLVEFCVHDIRLLCLRHVQTRFGRTNDEHTWTRTIARVWGVKDEHVFRTLWENIRNDLFARKITRASDKLPAMASLAQMLRKTLVDREDHK
jgi:hypothetical protein